MGDFGKRGECPECGKDVGLVAENIRFHKDDDGEVCSGKGGPPKVASDVQSHETERTDPK